MDCTAIQRSPEIPNSISDDLLITDRRLINTRLPSALQRQLIE
ncbi:hypothetical protein NEISICOT_03494 [Neisseria sicca ATCC 29256]|uniref:Uncharacterized protein n=1 Tax=Neisseria sicca ATCC 29256 TaxID=547045 RepID=C6MAB2_NEISI|nr:hypothetical protein NEISICOT_03494 [Neisseria sicca ATCC 29256]